MRRGHHLERNIRGKELGSIWLRHRIKISGLSVHTIPDFTAHSKISTLENGLKRYWFVCPIHGIRADGSRIRKETVADSKISGYVWTGPERNNSREYYHVTCIVRGSNVAQTRCLFLFYQFRICSNPLLSTPYYYNHVLCYSELSTFSIKILSRVTNIELTSFWLARG